MTPVEPPGEDPSGPSLARPTLGRHRHPTPTSTPRAGGARRRRLLVGLGSLAAVVVAAVVALAVVRSGGGGSDGGGVEAGSPTTSPTASSSAPSRLSAGDLSGVETSAQKVLTAWGHPRDSYHDWWADLSPMLTPGARADYARTDPRNVPSLTLTGEPQEVDGPSRDTATVYWATSQGRFGVDLSRTSPSSPWRMVRILFPGQESSL